MSQHSAIYDMASGIYRKLDDYRDQVRRTERALLAYDAAAEDDPTGGKLEKAWIRETIAENSARREIEAAFE